MENPPPNPSSIAGKITQLGDDLLHNILSKLPAKSFALAACVNRSWNGICSPIISRPNLCSAISLNPSLPEALKEVVGKVLSGPIQPHFAILSIDPEISLEDAHKLMIKELGSSVPIVTCKAAGVIGRDALTDQYSEVNFPFVDDDDSVENADSRGISLTVGYVPGLKVDAIPLFYTEMGPSIDKFVKDVKDFSESVSGCTSPEAMIMFGDSEADLNPTLEKLDYSLSKKSIIAGNENCCFMYGSINKSEIPPPSRGGTAPCYDAVALVFARDTNKSDGLGKIEFHYSVGAGITAIGPTYKVVSAKRRNRAFSTWLTAKRQGEHVALDGQQMLDDVNVQDVDCDVYIGVTKRRKCLVDSKKVKPMTSLTYHRVQNADAEYLYVHGHDIKTGDPFRFYTCDTSLALSSCATVSGNFRDLKDRDIVGGFIFACCGRGSTYFEKPNVDSSPFLDNFPDVPLAGMFCDGEIGRGPLPLLDENQDQDDSHSYLHVYSSVYLLMSYSPPRT